MQRLYAVAMNVEASEKELGRAHRRAASRHTPLRRLARRAHCRRGARGASNAQILRPPQHVVRSGKVWGGDRGVETARRGRLRRPRGHALELF